MTTFETLQTRAQRLFKRQGDFVEPLSLFYELPLFVAKELESTMDGAVDGSTIVCSDLIGSDYNGYRVYIMDKDSTYCNEERLIDQPTDTGVIHVSSPFSGQILSGIKFWIVGLKLRDTDAHVSDKAIDARLFNTIQIIVDNGLDQDVSVQLKGKRHKDIGGEVDIDSAFTAPSGDTTAKGYVASTSCLQPWMWVSVSASAAPTSGMLFVYGLVRNV